MNPTRSGTIVPFLTIAASFASPAVMFSSTSASPLPFTSIHPHTASCHHCTSLSALSDSQNCNATPLTWECQSSAVMVGETCLEAALLSFFRKQMSTVEKKKAENQKRELWSTRSSDQDMVYILWLLIVSVTCAVYRWTFASWIKTAESNIKPPMCPKIHKNPTFRPLPKD